MITLAIKGGSVLVDDADAALVGAHAWWVDAEGYASGYVDGQRVRLHRVLGGDPVGRLVDHRNRNRLDCRRDNLRVADRGGNARNSSVRSHNTSGFRGVYLCRQTGRWRAEIRVNGRAIKLGRFDDKAIAARAYDAAARQHHGEFAVLNFVAADNPGEVGRGCQ